MLPGCHSPARICSASAAACGGSTSHSGAVPCFFCKPITSGHILWLAAAFAVITVIAILVIPASHIDNRAARGATHTDHQDGVEGLQVLVESPPLLALAAAITLFHLGNAAMLPLYGLAVVATHANPFIAVASTVVIAQGVMVGASLAAMRIAETRGYWLAILIAFIALPIRGALAATVITGWGVIQGFGVVDSRGRDLR
jgi:hypothetical protein